MAGKPDYSIGAIDKTRDLRHPIIGAAWKNKDGTINIRLDPFIQLCGGPETVITLFPSKDRHAVHRHDYEEVEIP